MEKKIKVIIGALVVVLIVLLMALGVVIFGLKDTNTVSQIEQQVAVVEPLVEQEAEEGSVSTEIVSEKDKDNVADNVQRDIFDITGWRDISAANDAKRGEDIVQLLPLLDEFVIDGKHITEWNVDLLIAKYGLYLNDGKYLNERESDNEYEVAQIEGDKKSFVWNKVSRKTGVRYAFELQEVFDEWLNSTFYTFVTLTNNYSGDNPWAKSGVTKFAMDNGLVDAISFLKFIGVSDSVAKDIVVEGQKYIFATDCPGEVMIPAVISYDWNGVKVHADELTIIYHQDIGRMELLYSDAAFLEWGR